MDIKNNHLVKRKINRLKDYDYSQNGAYFITICSKNKENLFGTVLTEQDCSSVGAAFCRPQVQLSNIGKVVKKEIEQIASIYKSTLVDCFVIMPNHIHMIITIKNLEQQFGRQNAAPTISRIINQFKRSTSIKVRYSIWQKSYHDHIIRNEQDYNHITEYIDNNPANWLTDTYYA